MYRKVLLSFLLFLLFTNVQADDTQRISVRMNNISMREFFFLRRKELSLYFYV